jgi:hypothetical protein
VKPAATVKPEAPARAAASEPSAGALPEGYAALTVAQVTAAARNWSQAELEAALAYEAAHAARKGATAAISAALAKEGD